MPLDILFALSPDDLLQKIDSRNVSVPPRGCGQTKQHRETWVTFRFLRTIASSTILSYPLRVKLSDKPDLILAAQIDAELQREKLTGVFPVPEYKYSDSRKALGRQRKIVLGEVPPDPLMGDQLEQNWYDAFKGIIYTKATKFKHSDFRSYPENWLLIYDNWRPHIPDSEVDAMIIKINQYLSECSWQQPFDRIFIQSSERMWKLC